MKNTILGLFFLVGLAQAQPHNVILRWNDVICSTTITANCNPSGVTYNIYKAPGVCPATNAAPSSDPMPFSILINVMASTGTGPITLSHTDTNGISVGQTWCYYATVVNGFTVNNITGLVIPNESAPSNYAQASLLATGSTPLAPGNVQAILQ